MSQPPQGPPPDNPPGRPPSDFRPPPGPWTPRHWANSILLGIVGGVVLIGLYVFLNIAVGSFLGYRSDPITNLVLGMLGWFFPLLYLTGAIVLTVRPATSRLGAGLLLAIGVSLLIAAGVCFAIFSSLTSGTR